MAVLGVIGSAQLLSYLGQLRRDVVLMDGVVVLVVQLKAAVVFLTDKIAKLFRAAPCVRNAAQHHLLNLHTVAVQELQHLLLADLALLQGQPVAQAGPFDFVALDLALLHHPLEGVLPALGGGGFHADLAHLAGERAVPSRGVGAAESATLARPRSSADFLGLEHERDHVVVRPLLGLDSVGQGAHSCLAQLERG